MVQYRRVYENTVKRYATKMNLIGVSLIFVMFMLLTSRGDILLTGYSGDSQCAGTIDEPCYAYLNFTAELDIYIYPTNDTTWAFMTEPQNAMREIVMQRSWGDSWRTINLSKTWSTKTKYALKLNKGQDYEFRFIGYKYNPTDTVKWGFGFQQENETVSDSYIDPIWSGYSYKEFFTKLIENHIDGDKGIAIFEVTNPTSVPLVIPIQAWSKQFDKVNGDIKSSKIELVTDTDEIVIKEVPNRVCSEGINTICSIDNHTMVETCVDFLEELCSIQGTKLIEVVEPKGTIKPLRQVKLEPNEIVTLKLTADLIWSPQINIEWFIFVNVLGTNFKSEDWAWWNQSFAYRRPIEINISENITDYQLKLNISYNGNMNNSFQDLRFVDKTDSILLSSWVETKNDGVNITEWTKGNFTTDNGTQMYMYYGNADAVNLSNGDNTFIFFDDFNDALLNTSIWSGDTGNTAISNSIMIWTPPASWLKLYTDETYSPNITIEFYSRIAVDRGNIGWGYTDTNNDRTLMSSDGLFSSRDGADYEVTYHSIYGDNVNWHRHIIKKRAGVYAKSWVDSTLYASHAKSTSLNAHVLVDGNGANIQIDYIFARTLSDDEPTYTIGAEESANTPPEIIANVTSPTIVYSNTDWLVNMTITDADAGDTITGYVQFYVNDVVSGSVYSQTVTNNTNTLIATLGNGNYSTNDNLTAEVWGGEGTVNTSKINITATVNAYFFIITLNNPANNTATTDTIPDFNFTVSGTASTYNCELFIDDVGYGINSTTIKNIDTIITANQSISDGIYDWNINCTSGLTTNSSEIRSIEIIDVNNLTHCTTLAIANMTYTLGSNVTSTKTCFTILADNITLDGDGYAINYSTVSTGYGVNNSEDYDYLTIKNTSFILDRYSTTSDAIFNYRLTGVGTQYINIINNSFYGDGSGGIYFYGGGDFNISNNTFYMYTTDRSSPKAIRLVVSDGENININNNIFDINDGGTGISFYSYNNVNIYNNTLDGYDNNTIGVIISRDNHILSDNIINLYNSTSYAFLIGQLSDNNNITDGSIYSTGNSYYVASASYTNLFKDTNFTERTILYDVSNQSVFSYTSTADENIIMHTKINFTIVSDGASTKKLIDWSSVYIKWNETNQTENVIGYYKLTGLISSHEYNITNITTGTTSTFINTDASGNLEFSIALDGTTTIIVQPVPNITIYVNDSSVTRYFEITDDLNVSAYSSVSGGTMCIGIDNPLFGNNYSCSILFYSDLLEIIPAIETFNDSSTIKTLTSNDVVYFTLNNYSEIQTIYVNISSLATNLSFGIDSFEHNIVGIINNTIANISTTSTGSSTKDLSFIGSSANIFYINVPQLATITSGKFNISSTGGALSQNLINDSYTTINDTLITNENITFYAYVPLNSQIQDVTFNISGSIFEKSLGNESSYYCEKAPNAYYISPCSYAFDNDYSTKSIVSYYSDTSWWNSQSLYGYANYTVLSDIDNITIRYKLSSSFDRNPPISENNHIDIYNYSASGWLRVYTASYSDTVVGYEYVRDITLTGLSSLSGIINNSDLSQELRVRYMLSSGGSAIKANNIFESDVNASITKAEVKIDMLNNGFDATVNITKGTPSTITLNSTLLQTYLDACTEDPCKLDFVVQTSHPTNSRLISIDSLNINYTNNPKNITIDIGDDETTD